MTPNPPGRPHFADAPGRDRERDRDASRSWRLDGALAAAAAHDAAPPFLSVVVPSKDEAAGLPRLVAEIAAALRPLCRREEPRATRLRGFEILIIDDGSTDHTPRVLRDLESDYPELRPIRLRANVGQSGATAVGFRAARGAWIATLDADLQNDPADLETLWRLLPGYDAALGWRAERRDKWSRRVVSRWANRVRNAVLGQSIRDTGCSVRIFRRDMAVRLPMFQGAHRFLGPLLIREGARVVQAPVNHRARPHGASHYNFRNRSFRVVVDLLGVAWLMRRPLRYEAFEPRPLEPAVAADEAFDRRRVGEAA
ncbi:glycosyltransferase family 2 protein [Paludisphaera soli]|uniref:glycosyltransferase family 2 protein n=1 Tax=Paludisphaera soli TaxID=2712865 RepID=UPI001F10FBA3|nr:glycosyltransferase family 2 protein [Paludisphaera soli]